MGKMDTAQLHYVEVMCESILHGAYAVLIVGVIWLLATRRNMPMIHRVMFYAGILMFILATIQLGFLIQQVTVVEVPLSNARAQVSIAALQFMIGDTILIWRVWVVWNKDWRLTVVPVSLMLAAGGVRAALIGDNSDVVHFASQAASSLIVANVGVCTLLISGRIWYLQREIQRILGRVPSHRCYTGVLMLVIESGTLYFLSQLVGLILEAIGSPGVHAVLDMQIPIIGILPTLIVLLVHLDMVPGGRAQEEYGLCTTAIGSANVPPRADNIASRNSVRASRPSILSDIERGFQQFQSALGSSPVDLKGGR